MVRENGGNPVTVGGRQEAFGVIDYIGGGGGGGGTLAHKFNFPGVGGMGNACGEKLWWSGQIMVGSGRSGLRPQRPPGKSTC